jgi:UDP-N-acetyl-D-mannosaminuronic acid dehydrogenase
MVDACSYFDAFGHSSVPSSAHYDPRSVSVLRIVVVGGCGHVGLPLGLALGTRGCIVSAYDTNPEAVKSVNEGSLPFNEVGADELLISSLRSGCFHATGEISCILDADIVIVVVGTPVDEHLNPDADAVPKAIEAIQPYLRDGQLLVLRSTVYPGVTCLVDRRLKEAGRNIHVAFCPERIAEGHALTELFELPQIISGCSYEAVDRARNLFSLLTDKIVVTTPDEAELAKLFTNTWRYIKFAATNQFYMIANDFGVDFERIRHAITHEYPRAMDMPSAGFAAGPCLFKDTMQLAAFNNNNFTLGHASMMVNEGLPLYVVSRIERRFDLSQTSVGILGMAFKGESDDTRSSLSYKLRRILKFKAQNVLCTDEYVTTDSSLVSLNEVLEKSDILVVGTPHRRYSTITTDKALFDIWNITGRGVLI